jgi:hypothetical protein
MVERLPSRTLGNNNSLPNLAKAPHSRIFRLKEAAEQARFALTQEGTRSRRRRRGRVGAASASGLVDPDYSGSCELWANIARGFALVNAPRAL